MKYFCFVFCFIFLVNASFSQSRVTSKTFRVQGHLNHLSPGQMILFFKDSKNGYRDYIIDTTNVDSLGNFYLETPKITEPVMVTLRKEFLSINLYAAPGYALTITGNVNDVSLFQQQKQITGAGAQANAYLRKADSLEWAAAAKDTIPWSELSLTKLLTFVNKYQDNRDSLRRLVFDQQNSGDKWLPFFNNISRLDTRCMKLYYLFSGVMNDTTLSYKQSLAFIKKYGDAALLHDLYNDNYIVSEYYRTWLTGTYPFFLREMQNRRTPGYKSEKDADIQIINAIAGHYRNQIRDIRLYAKLEQTIQYCPSFEDLSILQEKLPVYIASLGKAKDRKKLDSLLLSMEVTLRTTQIGKPAPAFTAFDSTGRSVSLQDYIGKVVYLDLWASWCAPCRAEIPHLKVLTEKYKSNNNNNVAFISIGVLDDSVKWKKAVMADKPTWLQLFDRNQNVQRSYAANAIPKFILINKKGEIVSFDAPKPSQITEVEAMIKKEIEN